MAPLDKPAHVTVHLGPKEIDGECGVGLVTTKVSHEATTMRFLQKEKTQRTLGNTKLVSAHEISFIQIVFVPSGVVLAIAKWCGKERIVVIKIFNVLKANDVNLKFSHKHAST